MCIDRAYTCTFSLRQIKYLIEHTFEGNAFIREVIFPSVSQGRVQEQVMVPFVCLYRRICIWLLLQKKKRLKKAKNCHTLLYDVSKSQLDSQLETISFFRCTIFVHHSKPLGASMKMFYEFCSFFQLYLEINCKCR